MKNLLSLATATLMAVSTLHAGTPSSSKAPTPSAPSSCPSSPSLQGAHPGVNFDIAAEGSTTGIAAIIDGTADIGMASRRAFDTEVSAASANGRTLKPTIVAYDGIAIIVNSANARHGPDQEADRGNLHR